jgi:hypothetical protein
MLPRRRVVLLGASNVRRGLNLVIDIAGRLWGAPLELLVACGLGRSYGQPRSVLGCAMPGIVDCGLWSALERRPAVPAAALVTDIGNDLMYGATVADIAGWVEECVDRLIKADVRVVMTPLPLCSIAKLSQTRFLVMRTLIYPRCRLSLATVGERALDLDARLRKLAQDRGLYLAEHKPEWYGLDPIHMRGRYLASIWSDLLSRPQNMPIAPDMQKPAGNGSSLRRWLYMQKLSPECHWILGLERRRVQPAGVLADGTTISLF